MESGRGTCTSDMTGRARADMESSRGRPADQITVSSLFSPCFVQLDISCFGAFIAKGVFRISTTSSTDGRRLIDVGVCVGVA